tara:strand:+ start:553 stop:795 length:243 start_codon:yes stop_codon:yes gene_type:complete
MEPLEYCSTPSLLKEVQRRFDDSIFIGNSKVTEKSEDYIVSLIGSYHGILGLTVLARMAAEAGDGPHDAPEEDEEEDLID